MQSAGSKLQRPPVELPLDIMEQITLHADRSVLLLLSQTSRSFVALARSLLFKVIEFNRCPDTRSFEIFLDLLDSPDATISLAVKTLRIQVIFFGLIGYTLRHRDNFQDLAARLSQLHTLELIDISGFIPPNLFKFFSYLAVTDVILDAVEFVGEITLLSLMQHFPKAMKRLTIFEACHFLDDSLTLGPEKSDGYKKLSHLATLDTKSLLTLSDFCTLPHLLQRCVAVDTFHLRLSPSMLQDAEHTPSVLRQFFERVGPTVKKLCIDLNYDEFIGGQSVSPTLFGAQCAIIHLEKLDPTMLRSLYSGINFPRCTNLSSVCIGVCIYMHPVDYTETLETIWSVLGLVPGQMVESMTIIFEFWWFGPMKLLAMKEFPWASATRHLMKLFPAVKIITFKIGRKGTINDCLLPVVASLNDQAKTEKWASIDIVFKLRNWGRRSLNEKWKTHWRELEE